MTLRDIACLTMSTMSTISTTYIPVKSAVHLKVQNLSDDAQKYAVNLKVTEPGDVVRTTARLCLPSADAILHAHQTLIIEIKRDSAKIENEHSVKQEPTDPECAVVSCGTPGIPLYVARSVLFTDLKQSTFSSRRSNNVKSEPVKSEIYQICGQDAVVACPAVVLNMASPLTHDQLLRDSRYPPGLATIHSYKIRRVSVRSCLDAPDDEKENDHPNKRRKL